MITFTRKQILSSAIVYIRYYIKKRKEAPITRTKCELADEKLGNMIYNLATLHIITFEKALLLDEIVQRMKYDYKTKEE